MIHGINGFHGFEANPFPFWFKNGFLLCFGYGVRYPPIRFGLNGDPGSTPWKLFGTLDLMICVWNILEIIFRTLNLNQAIRFIRPFFLKVYFQFAIFCFHGFIKLTKSWYIGLNGFHGFEAKSFLFWCWFEIGFLLRFGYGAGYPPIRFGLGWRLNGGLGWNGLSGGNWI